ncbi:MAG: histidine--tRNA ligase [Candidatus Saccharimonadales bacterium]
MAKLSTQSYKGARDFYPEDKRLQEYIFNVWRRVCQRYGYEEYTAPVLEPIELYTSKTSDEIVNEQTYSFTDRGGRTVVMRPEMTPSVSRMVAARRQELAYPLRWFSIPDCWRYERPQRGRNRQFWQLNVDLFGVATIDADLEIISVVDAIMKEFGADETMYQIKINSRKLINLIMNQYLELDATQAKQMVQLFDRKDKMPADAFVEKARAIFKPDQAEVGLQRLYTLIKAKTLADLPESVRETNAVKEVQLLFTLMAEHQITSVTFDITLMRGFDYYTDIVFEVVDLDPENNRSMFGGGRYDGLVGAFGVEPIATVGFGMGDAPIENFLESHNLLPKLQSSTQLYVVTIGDVLKEAQAVVRELRENGVNVAVDLTDRKPDKQIKAALKLGVSYLLFIGEDELQNKKYILRNVETQKEDVLDTDEIVKMLQ